MNKVTDKHRIHGRIEDAQSPYVEDHGILTVTIGLKLDHFYQKFGGLVLEPHTADDFVRQLCITFGVRGIDELVGEECYALYSFGRYHEPAEGLESVKTGRRFLLNTWCRMHYPKQTEDRLVHAQKRVKNEIAFLERRIEEEKDKLAALPGLYIDWEKQP